MNSSSSVRTSLSEDAAVRRAEKKLLQRIEKTRADVKRVDLFSAICAFATFGLGVLFLGILFDHWILPNGFSSRGRLIFFAFWVVSSTFFFAFRLFPALRRRVNPLFAAKTLEESWEDRHNLTINWFQLRSAVRPNGAKSDSETSVDSAVDVLEAAMLRGVVLQAAKKAESAPFETTVDCAPLIRWGVAFAVVVAVCVVYSVFSPKNPFASAGRVAAPFAKIDRPQAIRFEKIAPGDAVVFQGDSLEIDAEIPGAGTLPVALSYSTEDGRLTDLEIPMNALGGSQFQAKFPDSDAGFEENLTYRVVVGKGSRFESRSPVFRVEVRPKPSFRVEKTTLKFPDYTGLSPQTFVDQGDVRALEGTRVELVARSNVPLEEAFFLPDGEETRAQVMNVSSDAPNIATFSFSLEQKLNSDGERKPAFSTYRLRSEGKNGEKSRGDRLYTVETLVDLPPTIRWKTTSEGVAEIPLNDVFRFELEAEDPDFSLRAVRLRTAIRDLNEGANVSRSNPEPIETPLRASGVREDADFSKGPTPFVGTRVLSGALVPEKLGLNVGDEIEYWAEAVDSKLPEPNVATSEKRLFVVVDPVANPSSPDAAPETPKKPEDEESTEENDKNGQNSEESQNKQDKQQGDSAQNEQAGKNNQETPEKSDDSNGKSDDSDKNNSNENADVNDANDSSKSDDTKKNGAQKSGANQEKDPEKSSRSDGSNGSNAGSESAANAENARSESDAENGADNGSGQRSNDASDEQNGAANDGRSSDGAQNSANTGGTAPSQNADSANKSDQNGESSPGSGDQESPTGGAAPENGAIDPDANPGDAFETILDFMNREKTQNSPQNGSGGETSEKTGADDENVPSDSNENGNGDGRAGNSDDNDVSSDEMPKQTESDAETNAESPSNSSDVPTERPKKKRDLPTRTSSEKPKDDAERFQANDPGKLDPNVKRDNDGQVDPDSNNFLAQNADANDSRKPKTADPNANITRDPLDRTSATPGDATDPNAAEARGKNGSNGNNDAPFEVVRKGEDADSDENLDEKLDENASENGDADPNVPPLAPNEIPSDAALGDGASNGGAPPASLSSQPDAGKSNGGGSASDRTSSGDESKKDDQKRNPTFGGKSDSPSVVRGGGGGGGSGLGELAAGDKETIAPADAPTLQYAEKATNLVLEYLENDLKSKKIDRRLLAELGWSEEELRAFLERWNKMKSDASNGTDDDAKNRYLQALENVGLTAETASVDATFERNEKRSRFAESTDESVRTKTPSALEERVRAFRRGVSNGR